MHIYVGLVLVRKDGAVLVQHRDNNPLIKEPNKWAICGGKKEWKDKSLKMAAARELLEETGYSLDPNTLKSLAKDDFFVGDEEIHRRFFVAGYDGVQEIHCFEGQEIVFIQFKDLDKLDFCDPYHRHYLKRASKLFSGG